MTEIAQLKRTALDGDLVIVIGGVRHERQYNRAPLPHNVAVIDAQSVTAGRAPASRGRVPRSRRS
jgi:hypothetical protein